MPATKFTCLKMCLMPHTIRLPHHVNGLSCTRPAAIRMGSFYCRSWTFYWPKNSQNRAASVGDLPRYNKMSPLGTEQPIRDVRSSVATEGVNRVWPNRLDSEAIDRSGHPTLFW